MKSLEKQYIKDTITSEELESLRYQVDNQTDEELFKDLQAQWMDDDNAGTADADAVRMIKKRVDIRLGRSAPFFVPLLCGYPYSQQLLLFLS